MRLRDNIPILVAVQTLIYHVKATAGIKRLVLANLDNTAALTQVLRDVGLPSEIEITTDSGSSSFDHREHSIVLAAEESQRETLRKLGYKPNLIFTESDLGRHVIV